MAIVKGQSTNIRCKYCQQEGFRWLRVSGQWRLYDAGDQAHTCKRPGQGIQQPVSDAPGTLGDALLDDVPDMRPINPPPALTPAGVNNLAQDIADQVAQTLGVEVSGMQRTIEQHTILLSDHSQSIDRAQSGIDSLERRIDGLAANRPIEVKLPGRTKPINLDRQHRQFPELLTFLSAEVPVWLTGKAGGFKTSAASQAAKALDVPFYSASMNPQTSKSDLLGFMSATGEYVESLLRKAVETGGLFLFDEIDASNPASLTIANAVISNAVSGFADGMVERHANVYFLAAANTYGRGADNMYVGRAQLDAATLDRFVMMDWEYDWTYTEAIVGNGDWTRHVQRLSQAVDALQPGLRVVIGPRAAIHGAKLLAAGVDQDRVEQVCIWKGISQDDREKICAKAGC